MITSTRKDNAWALAEIACQAFERAIASGRLSEDPTTPNWAGHYMYMGTHPKTGRAAFKHRDTREYLK